MIVGGAFTKIVNSLVADVLMPPIGYLVGGKKFTDIKITLPRFIPGPWEGEVGTGDFECRQLLAATLDFDISACIFAIVK